MKRQFLGDSYDIVKRLWADLLRHTAPLYAAPLFYQDDDKSKEVDLQREFTRLTGIQMKVGRPSGVFSILLDPDTGISLIDKPLPRYVTTEYIAEQLREPGARYVVTYDQSFPRCSDSARRERMQQKMKSLAKAECLSLYYASHASFLFTARYRQDLQELKAILTEAGVPAWRIEELGW